MCVLSLSLKNNKFKRLNNDTSTLIYTTHDDLFIAIFISIMAHSIIRP